MFKPSNYLMNEEGSSPGGGAAPATPPAPPATNGATPAPSVVPVDQLAGVLAEQMTALRNGIFADLRKAGVFKEAKTQEALPPPQATIATSPSAPDPTVIMALRDAFDDATSEFTLTKGQRSLLREHVMSKRPDVSAVESVVGDYVKRAGWSVTKDVQGTSAASPTQPPATQQPAANPEPAKTQVRFSDKGPAAPSDAHDSEAVWNSRPLEATDHDRDALILKHGHVKAHEIMRERILAALRNVKLVPESRRQRQ